MSIESKEVEITRLEISIPYNNNTYEKIRELRDYIVKIFGGLTHSRIVFPSHFQGVWDPKDGTPLIKDDVVLFILYFTLEENPKALEILKALARMIHETGEIEAWLVYQNALCCKSKLLQDLPS